MKCSVRLSSWASVRLSGAWLLCVSDEMSASASKQQEHNVVLD